MDDAPRASAAERERFVAAPERHFAGGLLTPALPVVDVPPAPRRAGPPRRRRRWA